MSVLLCSCSAVDCSVPGSQPSSICVVNRPVCRCLWYPACPKLRPVFSSIEGFLKWCQFSTSTRIRVVKIGVFCSSWWVLNLHPGGLCARKQRPATLFCRSPKGRTCIRREQVMGTWVFFFVRVQPLIIRFLVPSQVLFVRLDSASGERMAPYANVVPV